MPSIYMIRKDKHKKKDNNLNMEEHEKVDIENEYSKLS